MTKFLYKQFVSSFDSYATYSPPGAGLLPLRRYKMHERKRVLSSLDLSHLFARFAGAALLLSLPRLPLNLRRPLFLLGGTGGRLGD